MIRIIVPDAFFVGSVNNVQCCVLQASKWDINPTEERHRKPRPEFEVSKEPYALSPTQGDGHKTSLAGEQGPNLEACKRSKLRCSHACSPTRVINTDGTVTSLVLWGF